MSSIPHESGPTDTKTLETVFRTLADRRRRFTLQYLRERDGAATVDELAHHVGEREREARTDAGPGEMRKRVYTSLYCSILPALDDENLLCYDRETGIVELGDLPVSLAANLSLAAEVEGN